MKDRVRSFLVFTTLGYRIIAFVVLPVLGIWIGHVLCERLKMPGYFMTAYLLVPVEIMIDHFVFGGICMKDATHLEYLKCSKRGEWVTQNALLGGMMRILGTMLLVFVGNTISMLVLYPKVSLGWEAVIAALTLLLSSFAVITLCASIGRFFETLSVYYVLGMVGTVLEIGYMDLVEEHLFIGLVVAAFAAVIIGYLSLQIAMKHIRESYYDKTVEDGI